MHTDPIADLLTRIRNAAHASHEETSVNYSKLKENILKVMKEKGFIENYQVEEENGLKMISISLKEGQPTLTLKRVSKPGQRIYIKKENLKQIKSGLGIAIISTSKGIMTNSQARKEGLGGELICEIC